jgi:hypothetical protein
LDRIDRTMQELEAMFDREEGFVLSQIIISFAEESKIIVKSAEDFNWFVDYPFQVMKFYHNIKPKILFFSSTMRSAKTFDQKNLIQLLYVFVYEPDLKKFNTHMQYI